MSTRAFASLLLFGLLTTITFNTYGQSQYTGVKKVAILCIEFYDAVQTGDIGGTGTYAGTPDYIDQKYLYQDYYDIVYSDQEVTHPDNALSESHSRSGVDWYQHGGLNRYIRDNSYGLCSITPCDVNSTDAREGGIINEVYADSSEIRDCRVHFLRLNLRYKPPTNTDKNIISTIASEALNLFDSTYNMSGTPRVDWTDVDLVIIIYAGDNPFSASKAGACAVGENETMVNYAFVSETYNRCFSYPDVLFHEAMHGLFNADEMYLGGESTSGLSGHFSAMGANARYQSYTPGMLDPWHRLKFGWLNFTVPNEGANEYETTNLHIVEESDNGNPPSVMVIPIDGSIDNVSDFDDLDKRYLIVENRRITNWDQNLNYREDHDNPDRYGERVTSSIGGFLIWGWNTLNEHQLMLYESDSRYDMKANNSNNGGPDDFYNGNFQNIFSLWSNPGIFDNFRVDRNMYSDIYRNIYIEIDEYTDDYDYNVIKRFTLDQPFVGQSYYSNFKWLAPSINDVAPLKTNTQNKICQYDGDTYVLTRADSMLVVMKSTNNGNTWREVHLLTNISGNGTGRDVALCDNGAIASLGDAQSGGVYAIWQMQATNISNSYIQRTEISTGIYNVNSVAVSGEIPRPSVAALDDRLAYCYRDEKISDPGIYLVMSYNNGSTWDNPIKISTTNQYSINPSIGLVKVENPSQPGTYDYGYVVAYDDSRSTYYSKIYNSITLSAGLAEYPTHLSPTISTMDNEFIVAFADHNFHNAVYCYRYDASTYPNTGFQRQYNGLYTTDLHAYSSNQTCYLSGNVDEVVLAWLVDQRSTIIADNVLNSGAKFDVYASTITGPTSYPHLFYDGAATLGVIAPDNNLFTSNYIPRLIIADLDVERTINPFYTRSGKRLEVVNAATNMHFEGDIIGSTIYNNGNAIDNICYSAIRPQLYNPIVAANQTDSLTMSDYSTLHQNDYIITEIHITQDKIPQDTLIITQAMIDSSSTKTISTSGEYRVPCSVNDTTILIYLELPAGMQIAKIYLSTSIERGLLNDPNSEKHLGVITTYSNTPFFKDTKRHLEGQGTIPLSVFPNIVRSGSCINVTIPHSGANELLIFDNIGRLIQHHDIHDLGPEKRMTINTDTLVPGNYHIMVNSIYSFGIAEFILLR
jgi:hypothetical protein